MSSIRNLASQTIWYGISNIAARFIGYLQTPIITYLLPDSKGQQAYGDFSILYAAISLLNIIFTYGMETAYFRFAALKEDKNKLFSTTFSTLLISTLVLATLLILLRNPLSQLLSQQDHPEYIVWAIIIIAIDTMAAIPFAKLRQEGRPRKYAAVKVSGIVLNLILTIALLYYGQSYSTQNPNAPFSIWYQSNSKGGLLLLPNIAQSALTFLLLFTEWRHFKFSIDKILLKKVWKYGSPMIIIGLGGMVNETMDRIMLSDLYNGTIEQAKTAVGVYGANYRIAIFISLFIQAFKMSAEPFFFNKAVDKDAPNTYAQVMKWFVITLCIAFLFTALFLDFWKYFIHPSYWSGLVVVPILLLANVFLGIYYNLIVGLKVTNHMNAISFITIVGAAITLVINIIYIPQFGMLACAWATLICYFVMMVMAYFYSQKYYPIPYPLKSIASYLGLMLCLYFIQNYICRYINNNFNVVLGMFFMICFIILIVIKEKNTLKKIPILDKFIK